MYLVEANPGVRTLGAFAPARRAVGRRAPRMGAANGNCVAVDHPAPPMGYHWEITRGANGCESSARLAPNAAPNPCPAGQNNCCGVCITGPCNQSCMAQLQPKGGCVPAADLAPNWKQTLLSNTGRSIAVDASCVTGSRYMTAVVCASPGLSPGSGYRQSVDYAGCPTWVLAPAVAPAPKPAASPSLLAEIEGLFASLPNPFPSFPAWEVYGVGALVAYFFFFRKKGRY